jgi:hypothetical protein
MTLSARCPLTLRRNAAADDRQVSLDPAKTDAGADLAIEMSKAATEQGTERAAQGRQAQATPVERAVSSPGGRTLAPPASRPAVVRECLCDTQCPTCGYYCTCGNKESCYHLRPLLTRHPAVRS